MDDDDLRMAEEALAYEQMPVDIPSKKRKGAPGIEKPRSPTASASTPVSAEVSKKVKVESNYDHDDVVVYDREEDDVATAMSASGSDVATAETVLAISDVDLLKLQVGAAIREQYIAFFNKHASPASNAGILFRYAGIKKATDFADVVENMLVWIVALQAAAANVAPFNLLLQTVATADVIRAACVASYGTKCMKWLAIAQHKRAEIYPAFQLHSNIIDRVYWHELLDHDLAPHLHIPLLLDAANKDTRERLVAEGLLSEKKKTPQTKLSVIHLDDSAEEGMSEEDEERQIRARERGERLKDAFFQHQRMMERIGTHLAVSADKNTRHKSRASGPGHGISAPARPITLYVTALREAIARAVDASSPAADATIALDDAEMAMDIDTDTEQGSRARALLTDSAPSLLHWFVSKTIGVCWRMMRIVLDATEQGHTCAVTGSRLNPGDRCYLLVLTMTGVRRHYYYIAEKAPAVAPGERRVETPGKHKVPASIIENWPLMKHWRALNQEANAAIQAHVAATEAMIARGRSASARTRFGYEDEDDDDAGGIDLAEYESHDEDDLKRARDEDEQRRQKRRLKKGPGSEYVCLEAGRSRHGEDDDDEEDEEEEEEDDEEEEEEEEDDEDEQPTESERAATRAALSSFRRGLKGVSAHTRETLRAGRDSDLEEEGEDDDDVDPYHDTTFYYEPGRTISVVDASRSGGTGGTESHTRLPTNKTIIANSALTQGIFVALAAIERCNDEKRGVIARGRAIYENATRGSTKPMMARLTATLFGSEARSALGEIRALFDALYINTGYLDRPPRERIRNEAVAAWLDAHPERLIVHHSYLSFLPRPLVSGEELPPVLDGILAYLEAADTPLNYAPAHEAYCAEDATAIGIAARLAETGLDVFLACMYQLTTPVRVPTFALADPSQITNE